MGAPLHAKAMVPLKSGPGVNCKLNIADLPRIHRHGKRARGAADRECGWRIGKYTHRLRRIRSIVADEKSFAARPGKNRGEGNTDIAACVGGNRRRAARVECVGKIRRAGPACGNPRDVQRRGPRIRDGHIDRRAGQPLCGNRKVHAGRSQFCRRPARWLLRDFSSDKGHKVRAARSIVGKCQHRLTLAARERSEELRNCATVAWCDRRAQAIAGGTWKNRRHCYRQKRWTESSQRGVAGICNGNAER